MTPPSDPSERNTREREAVGRTLGIANTSSISPSGSFPGVVLDESRLLLERLGRVDVIVFAPGGVVLRDAIALPERLNVHYARLPRGVERLDRPLRMAFEMTALTLALLRVFRRSPVNILRADDTMVTGLPAAVVGKLLGIPVYIFLAGSVEETVGAKMGGSRGTGIARRVVRWLEGRVLRGAVGVLAVNRALAVSAGQQGAKLVKTTTSFVDVARFTGRELADSAGRPNAPFQLRYLGRLEREKGVFDLLEAMDRLRRAGGSVVQLEFVGDGSQRTELEGEVMRRSLSPDVSLHAPIPHDEVPALLASTDLLVLPSYTEGSPTVVFEAMLAGVPVLATRVGSLPDDFRDGEDIVFVETGSPDAIVAGVRRLAEDAELRKRVRGAARVKARALVARYIPTQLEFIARILAGGASELG